MKTQKTQDNVHLCIIEINEEISKLNFKDKSFDYKDIMKDIVIRVKARKYGLKFSNIKMIYEGRMSKK